MTDTRLTASGSALRGRVGGHELADRLIALSGTGFLLSFFVPQVAYYGRGGRGMLGLFLCWAVLVGLFGSPRNSLGRELRLYFCLLMFSCVAVITYVWRTDTPEILYQGLYSISVLGMVFAVSSYHLNTDYRQWVRMRMWVLFITAAAVVPSIPVLYKFPQIARFVGAAGGSGVSSDDVIMAIKRGVGTYSLYTQLAVCLPWFLSMAGNSSGWRKQAAIAASSVTLCAILISTFTAAAVLSAIALGASLTLLPRAGSSLRRVTIAAAAIMATGALLGGAVLLSDQSAAIEFITSKAESLFSGIWSAGLVEGDSTGRGYMFVRTVKTFLANPILGVGYSFGSDFVGGHSSWIDPWAQFGIVGYLPLFTFQVLLTRRVFSLARRFRLEAAAKASALCWLLYWGSGILNPVIFSVLPAVIVFSDWQKVGTEERRH